MCTCTSNKGITHYLSRPGARQNPGPGAVEKKAGGKVTGGNLEPVPRHLQRVPKSGQETECLGPKTDGMVLQAIGKTLGTKFSARRISPASKRPNLKHARPDERAKPDTRRSNRRCPPVWYGYSYISESGQNGHRRLTNHQARYRRETVHTTECGEPWSGWSGTQGARTGLQRIPLPPQTRAAGLSS